MTDPPIDDADDRTCDAIGADDTQNVNDVDLSPNDDVEYQERVRYSSALATYNGKKSVRSLMWDPTARMMLEAASLHGRIRLGLMGSERLQWQAWKPPENFDGPNSP